MRRFIRKKMTLLVLILLSAQAFSQTENTGIIPVPRQFGTNSNDFVVNKEIRIYTNLKGTEKKNLLFSLKELPFAWKLTRNKIKNDAAFLKQASDSAVYAHDGYALNVSDKRIQLNAATSAGLFYGLQTLRQLIRKNDLYVIQGAEIVDKPRFEYRGLMLDVSRHFYPLAFVKKQIDAMAYYKLNRLHLHLTDAAGWRIEIKKYPRLTSYAAWRPQQNWKKWWNGDRRYVSFDNDSASGGFYTQKEIRELVKYAAERHVTIIPEIEMPAHSEETMAAYPFLSCPNVKFRNGDVCAGKDSTYEFFENVLEEVLKLFPSEYIHIGGDEAGKTAWKNCPYCKARMEKEKLTTFNDLQACFIGRIANYLHLKGRKMIGWDEITEGQIPGDAVIMSWRGEQGALNALKNGNQAIMTPGEFCYLDAYQDAPLTQPEAIGGYLPLEKVYSYNPLEVVPTLQQNMIRGVQANLWTEYVPTPEHAEYMIWPRLLALSEVAWSEPGQKSWPDFHRRALSAVGFLKAKGYHTFDLCNETGNRQNAQHPVNHKAVGKKVFYAGKYSDAYPAGGETALTDGLCGGWSYNDKRWQGFIGPKRLEVVVDLDSIQQISAIQVCFLQSTGAEVYLPSGIEYSISEDGEHFTKLYSEDNAVNTSEGIKYHDADWKGSAKGRYVKVKAIASPQFGGWVFTDEIRIN